MKIDIVVATCNRELLLSKLLGSIRRARVPDGVSVRVVVADNNSKDGTRALVERLRPDWQGTLDYVFEPRQGKSFALNAGIAVTRGDVVGFLDDDEEMDAGWLAAVERTFADEAISFSSGPYLPIWGAAIPKWLPPSYPAIIGWIEAGPDVLEYGRNYSGMMMGGNAVVRTSVLKSLGGFNTGLGRTGSNLCGCEDADLSQRLLASGARGLYVPGMIIHHFVPAERLTKRYYRRWCLHHGVSRARAERIQPQDVPHVLGIPRYTLAAAFHALPGFAAGLLLGRWNTPATFEAELKLWDVAGFIYAHLGHTPEGLAGLSRQAG
jgi:glucosyl-dolichyl phosphate glucuronosyltransferase